MIEQFNQLFATLAEVKATVHPDAIPTKLLSKIEKAISNSSGIFTENAFTIGETSNRVYGKDFSGVYIIAQSSFIGNKNDSDLQDSLWKAKCDIENSIEKWKLKYDEEFKARVAKEKSELLALFPGSIFHEEIPNEYNDSPYFKAQPWLSVTTTSGIFKIGWRKRVISLDWSRTLCKKTAEDLFEDENTTKGNYYIHAWSLDDAKKYINTIISNI